ncbi:MAG TPA: cell division protein ZapA [Methylomirabilota bacterium]|nr:cell division protein ZapA [Methylomirabilota bacterium]
MAEPRRVDVEILGQRYAIRSDAPPDYVRQLVAYVEKRVKEIRGDAPGQDPTKILVLTALDITDELFRLRDETGKGDIDITARLGALIKLLDAAVPPSRG